MAKNTESSQKSTVAGWGRLYGAVVAYTALLIIVLYIFTITLDLSSP